MCAAAFVTLPCPGSVVGDERRCRASWRFPMLDPPAGNIVSLCNSNTTSLAVLLL